MSWWQDNKIRMIQNNLQETSVQMDPVRYAQTLQGLGANTAMIGCGGISALYPTELSYQRKSPFLQRDFVGEVTQACHDRGIKVILRFDFAKVDAGQIAEHPDWFIRNDRGECMIYEGTGAACVNGDYYQHRIFDILREVLSCYPADGIFFNAFSFGSFDYDGNRCDICRCENCSKRFREFSGQDLPLDKDESDPVYQQYLNFQEYCLQDLLERVKTLVRSINPDLAVSTYNNRADLIRNESNTAVDRPLPFWIYMSSDNTSAVTETYSREEKISCNVVINFVDFFSRFMGVSPELTRLRLLENMACGGALDWCILGDFEHYPDKRAFEVVRDVFHYHARYEDIFSRLEPDAEILLVRNRRNSVRDYNREYRGIFKMLKESHRIFRVIEQDEVDRQADHLDEYKLILLPDISLDPNSAFCQALLDTQAAVIATGLSFAEEDDFLQRMFGVRLEAPLPKVRGHYLLTEPKRIFRRSEDVDWIYLDMDYRPMALAEGNVGWMPLVTSAPFGPPEFCYGHEVTDIPTISVHKGRFVYIPFQLGTLYYQHGFTDFKNIFLDVMDALEQEGTPFTTNAPSCVEMFWHRCGKNRYLLQMLNLSGCNGISTELPLPLYDLAVDLRRKGKGIEITELSPDGPQRLTIGDGWLRIPKMQRYKAYLLQFTDGSGCQ